MRTAILAFMFAAVALFSTPIIAAELPALGENFPEGWIKKTEQSCTTNSGVKLKIEVYMQLTDEGVLNVLMLSSKNDVHYAHTKISETNRVLNRQIFILKDNKVLSFNNPTPEEREKIKAVVLEVIGLTPEERKPCIQW